MKPQSCILPAALLIFLFLSISAFPAKKSAADRECSAGDKKIYKDSYKKRGAGSNRDITQPGEKQGAKGSDTGCYVVKKGDTLFSIAKRSGTTVDNIQELNRLDESSRIHAGMKLRVPSKNKGTAKSSSKSKSAVSADVGKEPSSSKPLFSWPLAKVKGYSSDGKDGVRPIGIIIRGNPGGEVIASDNGVVKKIGYMRGYGKYIVLCHEKKYITVYSNLMDVNVKTGDKVRRGGRIGNLSDDMTLHFQIDRNGKPENPVKLLPVRS